MCLMGGFAAFFDVAFGTGTNDIFPNSFATHAARYHMVEGKLTGRKSFTAILTVIFVACVNVSAIELDFGSRQAVVEQQADDARDGDVKVNG